MITSRPVFICPSTCTVIRSRSPLSISVCWVSARPISHGAPACLSEVSGAAPVPPSQPEMSTTSGLRLGHAGRDGAHADRGDELDVDPRVLVGVLEVVDELLEVLDGVDVVVRRRADQPDARRGVPDLGDPRVDLVAGELPALAGLGALGHLDLDVVGVDQVLAGDPEPARGDLLDRASAWSGRRGGPGPRRPRRCWTGRRGGSWRWRGRRAPRPRSSRSTSRRWRSA